PDVFVWPPVTVQLPLYNERYVARRLLQAAANLDYPSDKLEIQVLDDSTDDTKGIVAEMVQRLQALGVDIVHMLRVERTGFKAGALAAGLEKARGEFVAIFDADFVPPSDFLRRTIPYFAESRVGVVQTRWGHLNQDFSLLTRAQSLGIDGHFGVEQTARCGGHLLLNFNGTAGIWRRSAIEDAGGWAHDTLTEDLDLSYRAQLRQWQILYVPEIVCPAELPVVISGFKSQQRRWAKGSIQTAVKLLPLVLSSELSLWTKYQAFVHLTYYMIHRLMLVVAVLSAFWSRGPHFVRTPKFGIGPGGGQWRGRRYASSHPWGGLAELGLGLYCAWTAWVLGEQGHYGVLPFMLLYTAGFLTVGALTVLQAMPGVRGAAGDETGTQSPARDGSRGHSDLPKLGSSCTTVVIAPESS